jgi:hypothetical protein
MDIHHLDDVYIEICDFLQKKRSALDLHTDNQLKEVYDDGNLNMKEYSDRCHNEAHNLYMEFKKIRSPPLQRGDFFKHEEDLLLLLRLSTLILHIDMYSKRVDDCDACPAKSHSKRDIIESRGLDNLLVDFRYLVHQYMSCFLYNEEASRKGDRVYRDVLPNKDHHVGMRDKIRQRDVEWKISWDTIRGEYYRMRIEKDTEDMDIHSQEYIDIKKRLIWMEQHDFEMQAIVPSWERDWCDY